MIVSTVKLLHCKNTGKVLNNIPEGLRDPISICISNQNKGSESTIFLAEELVKLYNSVYKGTSKKTLLFLFKLLVRIIENSRDRYIDITEHPSIPLKRAALRKVVKRLEDLKVIEYYNGWASRQGTTPPCIRTLYTKEELATRAGLALDKKISTI